MANRLRPENATAVSEAGEIRRFAISDLPVWGEWLIARIGGRYPGFDGRMWLGKIHQLTGSNDFLFIRNERAVLCIGGAPRALDGGLVFIEIFAFSRDAVRIEPKRPNLMMIPHQDPGEMALALLYRHARSWVKAQNGVRLFVGQCSDILPTRLKELVQPSVECNWISIRV